MAITNEQLKEAQTTIFTWFLEQNNNNTTRKPITMLDTDISVNDQTFRLITFMTFHGRDELPPIDLNEEE